MKLIGIKLNSCDSYIRKTLHEDTWYPFGQYQEPTKENGWTWQSECQQVNDTLCKKMYKVMAENIKESLDITVNCIVGKNGSGKSSLLDILYRIINNFSYYLIKTDWTGNTLDNNPNRGNFLVFAKRIDAALYFESDGFLGCIHNCYDNVFYSYYSDNKDARFENLKIDKDFSKTKIEQITRHFFYSICTNYSIHSFNEEDYTPSPLWLKYTDSNIDGKWIKGLFHKNDGYVVPITMVPFRNEKGNIDILKENYIAKQRLATLALLFSSQKKMFMGEYIPKYIYYRFNDDAHSEYKNRFVFLCKANFLNLKDVEKLLNSIKTCWKKEIQNQIDELPDVVSETVLMYLAYKTVKTCILYREYGEMLGVSIPGNMNKKEWDGTEGYNLEYSDNSINAVVTMMKKDSMTHVNLKIRQILYWLDNETYNTQNVVDQQSIPDSMKGDPAYNWNRKDIGCLYKKTGDKTEAFKTFDQAFLCIPPSFFEWDISFTKKNSSDEECLSLMSSGERQLMHSISYIIYHIKNIESITDDNNRLRYHNISLIFDEAELYYHPDYQRSFISNLIKMLSWCHIDYRIIRGVNILIVTHSPFVLSDVPLSNTLYLEDGNVVSKEKETFCGNIHEILGGNFFMDYSIGDVARENVEEIIRLYKERHNEDKSMSNKTLFNENLSRYKYIASIVADQYLNIKIKKMINELEELYAEDEKNSIDNIDMQIQEAKERLQMLEEKKKTLKKKMK